MRIYSNTHSNWDKNKEMTVPKPSMPIDEEQSLEKFNTKIIPCQKKEIYLKLQQNYLRTLNGYTCCNRTSFYVEALH